MTNSMTLKPFSKKEVLDGLFKTKIVGVIRIDQSGDLVNVSKALLDGGINFIEITMTVPNATKAIEETVNSLGDGVFIGAGTVLTVEEASDAIAAGASYIVSPVLNQKVIDFCNHEKVVIMPGCVTPTEVYNAWHGGADVVKIFPAEMVGPRFFRDLKGPLPDVKLMPTGSLNFETVGGFIEAGACAVGIGPALVSSELIATKQYKKITQNARKFVEIISQSK